MSVNIFGNFIKRLDYILICLLINEHFISSNVKLEQYFYFCVSVQFYSIVIHREV